MKIGVLTSSRADYGIYLPLLQKMKNDSFFDLEIIAFGTHLSKFHGYTIQQIKSDSYSKIHEISSLLSNDDSQAIATSYGLTVIKFADFWANNPFDAVFCLGDRFEMNAAVQAGIPFGMNFIHLYGGDTTLGAIDDIYRHQITLASKIHIAATVSHKERIENILGKNENIYSVGSLSLDEINSFIPVDKKIFYDKFNIIDEDFALITFHPETVAVSENVKYANEMKTALAQLSQNIYLVITMPNADTLGTTYRQSLDELKAEHPDRVLIIENFGKVNYFSAMYYAAVLIGNTSSGIVEAASFRKYVINVGDRQKGRAQSENVFNTNFDAASIVSETKRALKLGQYQGGNIYYKEGAADAILKIVKDYEKL